MMPDTTDVELNDFAPIEPGWYSVRVTATEEKESKKGNPYAEFEFVLDGGRKVWGRMSYSPDALWKLKQFKLACGGSDTDTLISKYVGSILEIYIDNEEWEGEDGKKRISNKVNEYRKLDSAQTANGGDGLPWDR